MSAPNSPLDEARRRIADCFHGRDEQGRLRQCRDALNLAGLGLTAEEIEERFVWYEFAEPNRPVGEIGFEDLIHLRYLDLTSNKLTRLPRGTRGFGQLRWLGLNFNQLTSIASEAGDWKELQRLYLRKNQLKTLPEAVATWAKLEEVDLAENKELHFLPSVWLERLASTKISLAVQTEEPVATNNPSSEASTATTDELPAEPAHTPIVELDGSRLAITFEEETGTKLTRSNFYDTVVQEWLSARLPHPWTPREIREYFEKWGFEAVADALASLGQRDVRWMSILERPVEAYLNVLGDLDIDVLDGEIRRMHEASTKGSAKHALWRAWFVSGFRLARARVNVGRRPATDGGQPVPRS